MVKPNRTRDLIGAVLLVLVGLLYMTGVSTVTEERAADAAPPVEIHEVSQPLTAETIADWTS